MKRWGAILCVLLLAGCASGRDLPRDPQLRAMSSPLIGGMAQIRDKALDPPDLERLFVAGLSHLSAIESGLHAELTDTEVILRQAELTIARAPRPHAQDIASWSDTVLGLIGTARTASLPLLAADSEALLESLYDGMMPLLDSYSRYYGRRETRRNQIVRNGFVGLGLDLEPAAKGADVRVIVKDGPADLAGILPGDTILRAQGRALTALPLPVILRLLNGPRDSAVRLRVSRNGTEFEVTVRRALIIPETVQAETRDRILRLTVKSFNQRTAADIAERVGNAGSLRGIILDLRGDPGGLLDQAVSVADLFLDHGVIATLRGRHPGAMQFYAATPGDIAPNVPIVVLVDGRSASASEILVAALQDNGRAFAVGTATVGKGSVQTIIPLSNGGEFALTWTRAYTPAGVPLSERGILPNLCTAGAPRSADELLALARVAVRTSQVPEIVRVTCRPEPRGPEVVDLEVARRLLEEPALRLALHPAETGQIATRP